MHHLICVLPLGGIESLCTRSLRAANKRARQTQHSRIEISTGLVGACSSSMRCRAAVKLLALPPKMILPTVRWVSAPVQVWQCGSHEVCCRVFARRTSHQMCGWHVPTVHSTVAIAFGLPNDKCTLTPHICCQPLQLWPLQSSGRCSARKQLASSRVRAVQAEFAPRAGPEHGAILEANVAEVDLQVPAPSLVSLVMCVHMCERWERVCAN